jgi:hypothetical protein
MILFLLSNDLKLKLEEWKWSSYACSKYTGDSSNKAIALRLRESAITI